MTPSWDNLAECLGLADILVVYTNLIISLALVMKASPLLLILSAEASLDFVEGLCLARQLRMDATSCIRLQATLSKGRGLGLAGRLPLGLRKSTLKLSGINI